MPLNRPGRFQCSETLSSQQLTANFPEQLWDFPEKSIGVSTLLRILRMTFFYPLPTSDVADKGERRIKLKTWGKKWNSSSKLKNFSILYQKLHFAVRAGDSNWIEIGFELGQQKHRTQKSCDVKKRTKGEAWAINIGEQTGLVVRPAITPGGKCEPICWPWWAECLLGREVVLCCIRELSLCPSPPEGVRAVAGCEAAVLTLTSESSPPSTPSLSKPGKGLQ